MRQWLARALLAAGLLSLGFAGQARADAPMDLTRSVLERARKIVDGEQPHDQKLAELSTLLKGFLDAETIGKNALDKHWSQFSAGQQQEFLALFRELFQRTYVQKLLLFEKPDFGYSGEQVSGATARVDTKIITPRDEFTVSYELRKDAAGWRAVDIKIEDMSLTANFRRQLDRLLTNAGPEELLNRMRKKYGPGGKGGDDDL